jgi:hypothetical protein
MGEVEEEERKRGREEKEEESKYLENRKYDSTEKDRRQNNKYYFYTRNKYRRRWSDEQADDTPWKAVTNKISAFHFVGFFFAGKLSDGVFQEERKIYNAFTNSNRCSTSTSAVKLSQIRWTFNLFKKNWPLLKHFLKKVIERIKPFFNLFEIRTGTYS